MTTTTASSTATMNAATVENVSRAKATRVHVRPAGTFSQVDRDLAIARLIARLMDSKFQVGPVKFGLDSVIGLLPGVGDFISAGVAMYPVFLARKHGLGRRVVAKMLLNIAVDFGAGLIPVVGDLSDVYFKANLRNLRVLEEALRRSVTTNAPE